MTVYVDPLQDYPIERIKPAARRFGTKWCHLTADSMAELIDFARRLGLSAGYFQRSSSGLPHFDLTPNKRIKAIELGAVEISSADMLAKYRLTSNRSIRKESNHVDH